MALPRDLEGLLRRMIQEETVWLRRYLGQVVSDEDPSARGRVKAVVPELGLYTEDSAIWCSPRQGYALQPPKKDEWVEVYFVAGDSRRPAYLVGAGEVTGNAPKAFADPKLPVLWQDATTGDFVQYDEDNQVLTLTLGGCKVVVDGKGNKVTINDSLEVDA
jgi:phage baseplate assembly protein gpV